MARKSVFVPASANGSNATLPLDAIPDDVKAEMEEAYTTIKANPGGRIRVEFDNKTELALFHTQGASYCAHRVVDGKPAPLRFRKSPTKNLPDTVMDYRVTDVEETETPAATPAATPAPAETAKPAGKTGKK